MSRLPLAALLFLACASPVHARKPARYALDPVHTRVMVAVDHAGFSRALGIASGATGTLEFEPGDWSVAHVEVTLPLERLDFGDARWNAAVAGRRLLDTGRHPSAHFRSTTVTPQAPDRARVCGELTLHAVTRPLCLEVQANASARHPLPPFRRTVGFSARGTLRRSDFGIDAWPGVIGEDVELRIEVEATRSRQPDDATP